MHLRRGQAQTSSVTTTGPAINAARRLRDGHATTGAHSNIAGMDKLQRVQDEIGEATDVMRQNIEAVVGRGEHLELLVDKSEGFSANARAFQKQSNTLRTAMWWKNVKTMLTMFCFVLILILLLVFSICGRKMCVMS